MPSAHLPEPDLRRVASAMANMWPEKYHGEVKAAYHVRGKGISAPTAPPEQITLSEGRSLVGYVINVDAARWFTGVA